MAKYSNNASRAAGGHQKDALGLQHGVPGDLAHGEQLHRPVDPIGGAEGTDAATGFATRQRTSTVVSTVFQVGTILGAQAGAVHCRNARRIVAIEIHELQGNHARVLCVRPAHQGIQLDDNCGVRPQGCRGSAKGVSGAEADAQLRLRGQADDGRARGDRWGKGRADECASR